MAGSVVDVAASGGPPRATGREWAGLAVLALPTLLVSMDLTVLHLAVPHISADLRPSSAQMLWIVDIYGFLVAGSLITMGTLGDRIGRRRLLLGGAAAFSAASVLAAFAASAEMLIATRALLGLAGATLLPSTVALIRNMFVDPRQRVVAIGIWAAVFSAGTAIGPVIGGVLLEWFWWGSVFLLGLPLMAGLLALGPSLLPEFRDPDAGRLDLLSAGLSLAGVLGVVYGLKRIAEDRLAAPAVLFIVAGLAVGVAFVLRQRKLPDPLIDLRLFRIPAFSVSLAAGLVALFTWAGTYLFLAQYLQLVKDLSPLEAGIWLLPAAGGSIAGSMLSPALTRRLRPATVLAAGLWVAASGFAVVTQAETTSSLTILVTGSIVFSIGIASTVALVTDQVVGAAPPKEPAPRRRCPKPAVSSALRSGWRSWAASAPPSTAATSTTGWPRGYPPKRRRPPATPSAEPSPSPDSSPSPQPPASSTPPARPSPTASGSPPVSACSSPPPPPSWSPSSSGEPRSPHHPAPNRKPRSKTCRARTRQTAQRQSTAPPDCPAAAAGPS